MEVHSEPNLLVHTSEESLQPNQAQHVRLSIIKNSDTFNAFLTRGTNFELNSHISGLDPTGRTMIIAISANVDAPDDGSSESEDGDWIGTLSVLSPRKLAQDPRDKPLPPHVMVMFSSGKLKLYMIIGVWVHAEHRRRGIGRLMVEYALEMISLDPGPTNVEVSTVPSTPKRVAFLNVREQNDAARELYAKIGFVLEADSNDDELHADSDWMSYTFTK